jgi:hypothetical protein
MAKISTQLKSHPERHYALKVLTMTDDTRKHATHSRNANSSFVVQKVIGRKTEQNEIHTNYSRLHGPSTPLPTSVPNDDAQEAIDESSTSAQLSHTISQLIKSPQLSWSTKWGIVLILASGAGLVTLGSTILGVAMPQRLTDTLLLISVFAGELLLFWGYWRSSGRSRDRG